MKYLSIVNTHSNFLIAKKAIVADGFFDRLMGLMFKTEMKDFDGLLILGSNSIHTCFMRFNIDVLFLNKENKVIKIFENMKPWSFTWIYLKAIKVLELPGGTINHQVKVGDHLELVHV